MGHGTTVLFRGTPCITDLYHFSKVDLWILGALHYLIYVILAVSFAEMYLYDQVHFIDPGRYNPKASFWHPARGQSS